MRSGQILIIVLLVIVVVLAVGLSVASRNITNLRTATQSEQSQRAFSAAEGGVEEVLSKLNEYEGLIASGGTISPDVEVGGIKNVQVVVSGKRVFENSISLGNVGQIKLTDENGQSVGSGKPIRIEWAKTSENGDDGFPASLEIAQIFGLPSAYNQKRVYAQADSSRVNESVNSDLAAACPGFVEGEFRRCAQITTEVNGIILRIKPFWANATVRVLGVGFDLPVQIYDVTSTAATEIGVTRRVQVSRTALPQLPAVFDYVLFGEGDVIK